MPLIGEGVIRTSIHQQIFINIVVDARGRQGTGTLDGDIGVAPEHNIVDGGEVILRVDKHARTVNVAAGTNEVVVSRVPGRGTAWQNASGGNTLEPKGLHSAICGDEKNVVVDRNALDRVLQIDVGRNVLPRVAVENIVVDSAVSHHAAVLPPDVQTVVMVGVRGRIPFHVIMDMVVVY